MFFYLWIAVAFSLLSGIALALWLVKLHRDQTRLELDTPVNYSALISSNGQITPLDTTFANGEMTKTQLPLSRPQRHTVISEAQIVMSEQQARSLVLRSSGIQPGKLAIRLLPFPNNQVMMIVKHCQDVQKKSLNSKKNASSNLISDLGQITYQSELGMALVDSDNRIIQANTSFSRILGLEIGKSISEALDSPYVSFFDDRGIPLTYAGFAPIQAQLLQHNVERQLLELRDKIGGKSRWVLIHARPVQINSGQILISCSEINLPTDQIHSHGTGQLQDLINSQLKTGVWEWNCEKNEVFWDSNCCEMLGYLHSEVTTDFMTEIYQADDRQRVLADIQRCLEEKAPFVIQQRMRNAKGEWVWIESRGCVVATDAEGQPVRMIGTNSLIQQQKDAESANVKAQEEQKKQIRQMAHFDHLTGLANRSLFEYRLRQHIRSHESKSSDTKANATALIIFSIHGIKSINREFGHDTGDLMLKEVSQRLTLALYNQETAARIGGTQLGCILKHPLDEAALIDRVETLHSELARPYAYKGTELDIRIYTGYCLQTTEALSVKHWFDQVQTALANALKKPNRIAGCSSVKGTVMNKAESEFS
ncbi:diguanylate cyclase domain-containing protein [Oceanospirillum sanctuarii]|uniref:diguanylate cyclase domain-containing protein n=1 Tax=Oceanospirillum sanctuarii TaxID=1434821 RepID=UPI000A38D680|nr:diguanylate cyclase [Oceanospirillum sanctuarii]